MQGIFFEGVVSCACWLWQFCLLGGLARRWQGLLWLVAFLGGLARLGQGLLCLVGFVCFWGNTPFGVFIRW
jgi:hypothetical protein